MRGIDGVSAFARGVTASMFGSIEPQSEQSLTA